MDRLPESWPFHLAARIRQGNPPNPESMSRKPYDLSDFEAGDEAVGVVILVGEKGLRVNLDAKLFGLGYVVNLSAGETERQGIAKGVDDHVNLRRQPAARTPYGLVEPLFFLERRRCVGGLARWLRRSSRTDCRDRPPKS